MSATSEDTPEGKPVVPLNTIYTVGHSNQPFDDLMSLLVDNNVQLLVDVRSHPGSKKHPHFNLENFNNVLGKAYLWMPSLGGPTSGEYSNPAVFPKHRIGTTRPEFKDVPEAERPVAWWNTGLHDYAEWMVSDPDFIRGIEYLNSLAKYFKVAIMCSEALWWKCHRSMISDFWEAHGGEVYHIMSNGKAKRHVQGEALAGRLARYEHKLEDICLTLPE